MSDLQQSIELIRSRNGLPHWTDDEIKREISRSIKEVAMTYTVDKEGKIDGICFGKWLSKETFHVQYITGNLKYFLNYLKDTFPNCKQLTGFRKGKLTLKHYEVNKLI